MTMLNILANITNQDLASQFLDDTNYQRSKAVRKNYAEVQNQYHNPSSPLADAQIASDNYRRMQQRKPMVIEYYKEKPTSADASFLESVEMYINPNRLSIQYTKVKQKAYTRGGIFYHHYGDELPVMSFSGVSGLSQMKFIEKLEQIYLNSGALLKYGNLTLNKVNNGEAKRYKALDFNNMSEVISNVISNPNSVVVDLALEGIDKKINNAKSNSEKEQYKLIKNVILVFKNIMTQSKYLSAYTSISNELAAEVGKTKTLNMDQQLDILYRSALIKVNKHPDLKDLADNVKIFMSFEMALPYLEAGDNSILSAVNRDKLSSIINDYSTKYLTSSSDKYDVADISSLNALKQEITNNPQTAYVTALKLINKLTVNKQIRDAGLEGFFPSEYLVVNTVNVEALTHHAINIAYDYEGTHSGESAWLQDILASHVFTDSSINPAWKKRLTYLALARVKDNFDYKNKFVIRRMLCELERAQKVYDKEKKAGNMSTAREKEIKAWILRIRDNCNYQENYYDASEFPDYPIVPYDFIDEQYKVWANDPSRMYIDLLTIIEIRTMDKQIRDQGMANDLPDFILDRDIGEDVVTKILYDYLQPKVIEYAQQHNDKDLEYKKQITAKDIFEKADYRIAYYKLSIATTNWNYRYPEIRKDVAQEIERCKIFYYTELGLGKLTSERKTQILNWVKSVRQEAEYMSNDWESAINSSLSNTGTTTSGDKADIIIKGHGIANEQATKLNEYIAAIQDLNDGWKIDREEAFAGWIDIADEVFDEYRPRVIFIYFEDRVYIGHFDSFSWTRDATMPVVNYEMRFTIMRQVLMSSTGIKPKNTSSIMQTYFALTSPNVTPPNVDAQTQWKEDMKNNPSKAYVEALKLIDKITLDSHIKTAKLESQFSHLILNTDQITTVKSQITFLKPLAIDYESKRPGVNIAYVREILEQNVYDASHRKAFFALARSKKNGQLLYPDIIPHISNELQRCKAVYYKELNNGTLTEARKKQILNWVAEIRKESEYTGDAWEKEL